MTLDDLGDKMFASAPEAAAILGRDPRTIRKAAEAGEIPARRTGKKWLIPTEWIRAEAGTLAVPATEPDYDKLADRLLDRMCARSPRFALLLLLDDGKAI